MASCRHTILVVLWAVCALGCGGRTVGGSGQGTGGSSTGTGNGSTAQGSEDGGGASSSGSTTGSGTSTSGTCGGADFESDPENCGRCGHSCEGGDCDGGVCQSVVLAELGPDRSTAAIVVDDGHVYWARANIVPVDQEWPVVFEGVPAMGGEIEPVGGLPFLDTGELAVGPHGLYWLGSSAGLWLIPFDGAEPTELDPDGKPTTSIGLASDNDHAYYVTMDSVMRVEHGALTPELVYELDGFMLDVQVFEGEPLWTYHDNGTGLYSVMTLPKDADVPVALWTGDRGLWALAADADFVYWDVDGGWDPDPGAEILRVRRTGGVVEPVASVPAGPELVVDEDYLYRMEWTGIWRMAKDGAEETRVVEAMIERDFAVDDCCVYFGEYAEGQGFAVSKIAKP